MSSVAPLAGPETAGAQSCPLPAPGRPRTAGRSRRAERDVHNIFSVSMLISALRCLLSYIILPVVTPALGAAAGAGPALGIPVGVLALVFDVIGIRRFWAARHRLRWPMTAVYLAVMALVSVLLARDISHFIG